MNELIHNRLTVLGSKRPVTLFQDSHWDRQLWAKHGDWLETIAGRFVCQFETEAPVLERLRKLAKQWPGLTFLLDYEDQESRTKGLAKVKAGELQHCEIGY